jgi:hypothetical protein
VVLPQLLDGVFAAGKIFCDSSSGKELEDILAALQPRQHNVLRVYEVVTVLGLQNVSCISQNVTRWIFRENIWSRLARIRE